MASQIKGTVTDSELGEGASRAGIIKLGAANWKLEIPELGNSDVYDFLKRHGGWDGALQQRIDDDAKDKIFHWGNETMNARADHAAMVRDAQKRKSSGEEGAWTDVASWDAQENVSSFVHVLGFLVAHGGRLIHHAYVKGNKSTNVGLSTKGCQGFVNWDWDLVPPVSRPVRDWYSTRPRGSLKPEPGDWKGDQHSDSSEEEVDVWNPDNPCLKII